MSKPSSSGACSRSCTTKRALPTPASAARRSAAATIAGEMSSPTTSPPAPTRPARSMVVLPGPHPTSRTRSPGAGASASMPDPAEVLGEPLDHAFAVGPGLGPGVPVVAVDTSCSPRPYPSVAPSMASRASAVAGGALERVADASPKTSTPTGPDQPRASRATQDPLGVQLARRVAGPGAGREAVAPEVGLERRGGPVGHLEARGSARAGPRRRWRRRLPARSRCQVSTSTPALVAPTRATSAAASTTLHIGDQPNGSICTRRPRSAARGAERGEALGAGRLVPALLGQHQRGDRARAEHRGHVELLDDAARELAGRPRSGIAPARHRVELGHPQRPAPAAGRRAGRDDDREPSASHARRCRGRSETASKPVAAAASRWASIGDAVHRPRRQDPHDLGHRPEP